MFKTLLNKVTLFTLGNTHTHTQGGEREKEREKFMRPHWPLKTL